jgi:hypothetical protein
VGSEVAPRTRARSARSTGNPLLASREAVRFRSASASRSGGAVHSCIGNIARTLNQADGGRSTDLDRAPRIPDVQRPSPEEGSSRGVTRGGLGGFHLLAAAALAACDVGVDRFVLPAVVPLVVDRKLGRTPRSRATAIGLVPLVGPRERPDRLAPETLLRHLVHVPSSLSPEDGSSARPRHVIRTMRGTGSFLVAASYGLGTLPRPGAARCF